MRSRPASILEMSRMSLMIASRCSPLRRMVDELQPTHRRRRHVALAVQQVGVAQDRRHGRADLVAHVGQEIGLGPHGLLGLAAHALQLAVQLGQPPLRVSLGPQRAPRHGRTHSHEQRGNVQPFHHCLPSEHRRETNQ
jgi:hypothetical protein